MLWRRQDRAAEPPFDRPKAALALTCAVDPQMTFDATAVDAPPLSCGRRSW